MFMAHFRNWYCLLVQYGIYIIFFSSLFILHIENLFHRWITTRGVSVGMFWAWGESLLLFRKITEGRSLKTTTYTLGKEASVFIKLSKSFKKKNWSRDLTWNPRNFKLWSNHPCYNNKCIVSYRHISVEQIFDNYNEAIGLYFFLHDFSD